MKLCKGVSLCVVSAMSQFAFQAYSAEVRSPGQGNPLDNLPRTESPSQPTINVDIQRQEVDPAMRGLLSSRITPSAFQISGAETVDFDVIAAEFSGMVEKEVTVAELLSAAQRVTQIYQQKGYPLSFAFVPAQSFDKNIVVINVVEGYISTVKMEGNPGPSEERLRDIAEQLMADKPLRSETFERVTGILGLQPGMKIQASVTPPANTDGAAEMVLNVKRSAFNVSLGLDTATSDLRGIINVSETGLTPLGEQISVSTLVPRGPSREKYYGLNYSQPIRKDGMLFQLSLSDYSAEPVNQTLLDQQFMPRYATETRRISASISYPLILKNSHQLSLTSGIYAVKNASRYTHSVTTAVPVVELSSDIRALNLELNSTELGADHTRLWMLGLYQGLKVAGARQYNDNVDLDFTRVKAHFVESVQFNEHYGVTASGNMQYSPDRLPLSEQISYGAKLFGLAYPAGEVAGDKGWGLALEFNRAYPIAGEYIKQVQPYVAVDTARVYSNTGSLAQAKLASLGIGLRFSDQQRYALDLSIAQPLGDIPVNADKRSPRLNLSYSYQLE